MTRYLRKPGAEVVVRCDPDSMPGIARDARFTVNALGLRGRMPGDRDTRRVLVVGASTVEDFALGDGETWCDRLAGLLGRDAWVGNAGRAGMRVAHSLLHVEEMLSRVPQVDAVVVLCGLNDMLSDYGLHMAAGQSDLGAAFGYDDQAGELPGDTPRDIEFGALVARLKARRRLVRDWIDAAGDPPSVERYRTTVGAISATVCDYDAQPVFVTQPSLWGNEAAADTHFYAGGVGPVEGWFGNDHTPWFTPRLLQMLLGAYNDALRTACLSLGARCVDLDARLPAVSQFYYDDFHFSVSGARAVAGLVADAFAPAPRSIYPLF